VHSSRPENQAREVEINNWPTSATAREFLEFVKIKNPSFMIAQLTHFINRFISSITVELELLKKRFVDTAIK
jgi:hypothetical protein